MIRQTETWKAFIVENQAYYNQTNERKFNLIELTPEERGWTELFQIYPPITSSGGSGTSPINGRSYSWTYGFLPVGYFGVKNQSRVFTSSGTWTCPEEVGEVYVKCVGKGANGNGGSGNGGGGGGFIMAKVKVVPGTSYSIIIDSAASSFGGVISALAANGSNGGNFTSTENVEVLFKGVGGKGVKGGGGGGSELGEGGCGGQYGGGGLHSGTTPSYGGGGNGMLSQSTSNGGAGFMSKKTGGSSNGKGMFSSDVGLKSNTSPYYNKLSANITENLGDWGTPNKYGGGVNNTTYQGIMFSGGIPNTSHDEYNGRGGNGGFGGGGGVYDLHTHSVVHSGGGGGYGGGGGTAKTIGTNAFNNYALGGYGGSGGGGGDCSPSPNYTGGGAGGYGGGGGGGGENGGAGGAGLVIIEW